MSTALATCLDGSAEAPSPDRPLRAKGANANGMRRTGSAAALNRLCGKALAEKQVLRSQQGPRDQY